MYNSIKVFRFSSKIVENAYTWKAYLYIGLAFLLGGITNYGPIGVGIYLLFQGEFWAAFWMPLVIYIWIGLFMAFWPFLFFIGFILGAIQSGFIGGLSSLVGNFILLSILLGPNWLIVLAMRASEKGITAKEKADNIVNNKPTINLSAVDKQFTFFEE